MSTKALEKKGPPLKFLLECSDSAVGNFELVKLSEVANLRNEMLTLFDQLVDVSAQAVLAVWPERLIATNSGGNSPSPLAPR